MKKQTLTMTDAIHTAKMLSEALPYLQRFSGAVVVVKFGGNAMGDDAAMAEFARDIVLMRQVGRQPGGGAWRRADDQRDAGQAGHRKSNSCAASG